MSPESSGHEDLWSGVAELVDGFDFDALAANGLVAVHAGSSHEYITGGTGARLALQLMLAGQRYHDALIALDEMVTASEQPIMLLKGLEVAQRYPEPEQRLFTDLDLLVRAPEQLADDLHRLGYRALPDIVPDGHHHLAPMIKPDGDFSVEIHRRPGWLSWMSPPTVDELFGRMEAAATPVPGLWTLDPVDHCLFVAVHAWADGAFRRGRDVLDIAVMRADLEPSAMSERADEWGIGSLWQATQRCVDALLLDGPPSPTTRLLTGHIAKGHARGPVSHRLAVYLADFLVTSPRRAGGSAIHKLRDSDVVHAVAG
jgi:hypothetical protein